MCAMSREQVQKKIQHAQLLADRTELLRMMPRHGVCCEAGVAAGDFSCEILEICKPEKLYLIDSWEHAGRYDEKMFQSVRRRFSDQLHTGQVEIIRAGSVEGLQALPDAALDFVYIDTDHQYLTTRMELAVSRGKVKPGGYLCGHDYTLGNYRAHEHTWVEYGVVKAVDEFMEKSDYRLAYLTHERHRFVSFALTEGSPAER